jgi:hypothetical protein
MSVPETSLLARADNAPRRPSQRQRVLAVLLEHYPSGVCAEEIGYHLGMTFRSSGSSAAKRLSELKRDGYVEPVLGARVRTSSGSLADVYRLTPRGVEEAGGPARRSM